MTHVRTYNPPVGSDLRDRLRRLGVHKGTAHLKPRPAAPAPGPRSDTSTPGDTEDEQTALGTAHVRRHSYPPAHTHGQSTLSAALSQPAATLTRLTPRGAPFDPRRALFLDTETTGLAGGAGTLAFLVGLGYFDANDHFVIEQYFLKDPAHEAAMLAAINRHVHACEALVTFNGASFDIPLLQTRYTLSRIAPEFDEKTHLDLLLPARRMWRNIIGSCSLGALEYHMLDVRRDQQDIAGFLIPQLYREYLQSGSAALNDEMRRVMYHNLHDILSMVTLIARLGTSLDRPRDAREHTAAGAYFERAGELPQAEAAYRAALSDAAHPAPQAAPALHLARLLKRQQRHGEALEHWQTLADTDDVAGLIELAKHCEWRARDLPRALVCALRARAVCQDRAQCAEIDKRVERLRRKLTILSSRAKPERSEG